MLTNIILKPKLPSLYFRSLLRPISTTGTKCNQSQSTEENQTKETQWIRIYRSPTIQSFRTLSRLKNWQCGLTAVAIPVSYILPSELFGEGTMKLVSIFGLTGTLSLCFASALLNRTVGLMYVDPKGKNLKISFLDFWGRKQDQQFPISNIKPFSETRQLAYIRNIYQSISFYESSERFKLFGHRESGVLNTKLFTAIFGHQ